MFKIIIFLLFTINLCLKRNFNQIGVAYGTDNNYLLPVLVSMTSIMENANNDTFINFYILVGSSFKESSKKVFIELKEKYINCAVFFRNVGDKYMNVPVRRWNTPAFYRLSLPEYVPELNKIIYLDGDTIVLKDLTEMYNLNMKDNLVMGFLDHNGKLLNKFNIFNELYINSGVMLMNLKDLRKYKYHKKIDDCIMKYKNDLDEVDQTVVNLVFRKNKGILPPKFGMWSYYDVDKLRQDIDLTYETFRYKDEEMVEAYNDPSLIHYIYKPWTSGCSLKFKDIYYKYVNLTKYSKDFTEKYKI